MQETEGKRKASKMAQEVKELATDPNYLNSNPGTHMKVLSMVALVCIDNTRDVETVSLGLVPA